MPLVVPDRVRPRLLPLDKRKKTFGEPVLGYSEAEAVLEAQRCLQCGSVVCMEACPLSVDVKGMIQALQNQDFRDAARILGKTNCLPGTTARVCPQLLGLCESACVMQWQGDPIAVGLLQRFVADWAREHKSYQKTWKATKSGLSVAIVGAGPAGLAAADFLIEKGHDVTIFEELKKVGGTAMYGIPDYHLAKDVLDYEVECIKQKGVVVKTGVTIGRDIGISTLFDQGFYAVLLATGCRDVIRFEAPGTGLVGVYDGYEFLKQVSLGGSERFLTGSSSSLGRVVAVVGGGNTAIDAARTSIRLGAEKVLLIYRRSMAEMPADISMIQAAEEEGAEFVFLTAPVRFYGDDKKHVRRMECVKMQLGEPDKSGRSRPIPVQGSNFMVDVDSVILAVGRKPDSRIPVNEGLKMGEAGGIAVDSNSFETSMQGVFAAGDVVTGETLVCKAMASGRMAAEKVHSFLLKQVPQRVASR